MTIDDATSVRHVPARDIPVPAHLSPEAQAMLSLPPLGDDAPASPALDDKEGWRARTAAQNEMVLSVMAPRAAKIDADVEDREIAGVPIYVITPRGRPTDDQRVFLDIHGGALVMGNGECCRAMGLTSIPRSGCDHMGGRLPDAARSPVSGAARRLRRRVSARCCRITTRAT